MKQFDNGKIALSLPWNHGFCNYIYVFSATMDNNETMNETFG